MSEFNVGDKATYQETSGNFCIIPRPVLAIKTITLTSRQGTITETLIGFDNTFPDWQQNPYRWVREEYCTKVEK